MKNDRAALLEEYADGKTTKEQFIQMKVDFTSEIEFAEAKVSSLTGKTQIYNQSFRQNERFGLLKKLANITYITEEAIALVEKIYVYDDEHIEIVFKFSDKEKPQAF